LRVRSSGDYQHVVGGKTGTGVIATRFCRAGSARESTVVSRAATFVFFVDDRFSGTITAFVPGPQPRYQF
jgi:hypothetical protein